MKMKKLNLFLLLLLPAFFVQAQNLQRPKLVVGIVVDQMRWDYLYRFYDRYGNDGFKRLLREGFSCENTFIPYTPTVTAAGHSCIYTGSVPALHGIMGNSWYDRMRKRIVYCTEDFSVKGVGTTSTAGQMSPRNLWSTTIGDELRLATNFRNKTISIAMKDRGAILSGGHASNGSFWFDNTIGGWITSSFYMDELPSWLKNFNEKKLADRYLKQPWNTLYPANTYTQSTADSNVYESRLTGEDFTFPHRTDTITWNKYEAFRGTPSGSSYTFETAKAAIEGEKLGARNITDFLAVSFSSPDLIGHSFGPQSIEVEDCYLRFDKDLAGFLKYLDTKIGKGQYLLFLTADHAVSQNPKFLRDHQLPTGVSALGNLRQLLNDSLHKKFSTSNIVLQVINSQVYLDDSLFLKGSLNKEAVKESIMALLLKNPAVANVIDLSAAGSTVLQEHLKWMVTNGYNQKLSGDLQFILKPQWHDSWPTGASHGDWNPYDAHIPLIWFGWKIAAGRTHREIYLTDITPTLAGLLHIQVPNACIGKTIGEVIR